MERPTAASFLTGSRTPLGRNRMTTDRSAAGVGLAGDDSRSSREWVRRLEEYERPVGLRRTWTGGPPNVLHLLSQQPGKTGSGVALLALTRLGAEAGSRQRAVIGLPADEPLPDIPPLTAAEIFPLRFDRPPVPFAVPGMSDIMPYPSTRFSDFTPDMLAGYLQGFADALAAATGDFRPDLIQSNHLWLLTAVARVVFPATPLCAYSHGTELRQLHHAAHLAPLVVPACADVDRVFALHADNRDRIVQAYGIPAARVRVVGAGFREDVFRPGAGGPRPADRDELTIVYAGKISAPKGVPWLIEAMRRVKGPGERRVRLLLAGSAGDGGGETIRRQAADMDNVLFLGALPQAELAAVLQNADVFVLPSFFEGLPLVVVESLACGCRVVMTDLPGVDGWMPAGLCAEGRVDRVPPPRLIGADTPLPADLPEFVARLAVALERQLAASVECRRAAEPDGRLKPLSWSGVFERMQTEYRELHR
jgi:glycosyltransferase involved in cell wall biosynthesis